MPIGIAKAAVMGAAGARNNNLPETGLVFRLDMGSIDTYAGSGSTFSNLVTSPADSEAQSAYDFTAYESNGDPGTEDTTPPFSGSPGTGGTANYFGPASGDRHRLAITTNTTFLAGLNQGGAEFSIMLAFRSDASGGTLFTTGYNGGTSNPCVRIDYGGVFSQINGSSSQTVYDGGLTENDSTNKILVLSYDESTGAIIWVDSESGSLSTATQGYVSPSGSAPSPDNTVIRGESTGGGAHQSRIYSAYLWNRALTADEVNAAYLYEKSQRGI